MTKVLNKCVFSLILTVSWINAYSAKLPEAKIIPYNNEDFIVDLGVGLWAFPVPYDYDNDGVNDVKTITSTYAMFAPYNNPKYTVVVVSPNVSHYNGKTDSMAYINRYLSNDVTKLIFEKY